jgi:hypothetical protein
MDLFAVIEKGAEERRDTWYELSLTRLVRSLKMKAGLARWAPSLSIRGTIPQGRTRGRRCWPILWLVIIIVGENIRFRFNGGRCVGHALRERYLNKVGIEVKETSSRLELS